MESKVDCSLAVNYIDEWGRMCEEVDHCTNCPISKAGNSGGCDSWIVRHPQQAVEIVQAWSDEHPIVTYLDKLLEVFPNTTLGEDGTPDSFCPTDIGLKDFSECGHNNCVKCWSQPYKENTNV